MECIICDNENHSKSVEHIVSESLGNENYVMVKGGVCDKCNHKFSNFEGKALSNSILLVERARMGISSKKGKNAKGEIQGLKIEGDKNLKKNHITITGLSPENSKNYNPVTKTFQVKVESFDKSQVATSKLLLKMAIESIYTSQNKLFKKLDFEELKEFLKGDNNKNWPFLTSKYDDGGFKSIPRFTDKHRLKKINCELKYKQVDDRTLLFTFKYGGVKMIINLLNRDLLWVNKYLNEDTKSRLYPKHFRAKLERRLKK